MNAQNSTTVLRSANYQDMKVLPRRLLTQVQGFCVLYHDGQISFLRHQIRFSRTVQLTGTFSGRLSISLIADNEVDCDGVLQRTYLMLGLRPNRSDSASRKAWKDVMYSIFKETRIGEIKKLHNCYKETLIQASILDDASTAATLYEAPTYSYENSLWLTSRFTWTL
ncbi:hypothetical protein TNCV_4579131 [Trichonephila clavipes]|nr:hypothetical protein TNCV_4579131 [Trichonephila clavipes]